MSTTRHVTRGPIKPDCRTPARVHEARCNGWWDPIRLARCGICDRPFVTDDDFWDRHTGHDAEDIHAACCEASGPCSQELFASRGPCSETLDTP